MGAGTIDFRERGKLESTVSDNGAVTLGWEKAEAVEVELQQADTADFARALTCYTGPDAGSVVTGLPEGSHYFRLRETGTAEWSPPLEVTVAFFPRPRLFVLLGLGGIVVAATIGTVIAGHFTTRREGDAP